MNSPAVDIVAIIAEDDSSSGIGLTIGTDLFVSYEPNSPDQCATVYDSGGWDPQPNSIYRPTVMVRVRGNRASYVATYSLAKSIFDYLHERCEASADSSADDSRNIQILAQGDINFLGYDDSHRPLFSMNFRLLRTVE